MLCAWHVLGVGATHRPPNHPWRRAGHLLWFGATGGLVTTYTNGSFVAINGSAFTKASTGGDMRASAHARGCCSPNWPWPQASLPARGRSRALGDTVPPFGAARRRRSSTALPANGPPPRPAQPARPLPFSHAASWSAGAHAPLHGLRGHACSGPRPRLHAPHRRLRRHGARMMLRPQRAAAALYHSPLA